MSVTLTLYKINCDPNTVDKTAYITDSVTKSGAIRGEFDVQNPVIECTGDLSQYNYAELNGRYYRIENCNRQRTGLSLLTLHTDVLWTYKDSIYNLVAVVNRSYRLVNSYLPDTEQKTVQYTQCVNKNIGSALDYIIGSGSDIGYAHIVVTVG